MPDENRHPLYVSRGRTPIRHPRLADPWFARNQDQAPAPRSRIVEYAQQRSELALASYHPTRWPSSKLFGASYLWRPNLRDETVAPCWYSSDETGSIGIVAQRPPDFSYRGVDAVLAIDEDALAPDALEDFFACDELSAALDQQA